MHDYCDWRLEFGESVVQADGRYLTNVWTEEAVGFIARHAEEPFFLHVTYNAPHTPLQAPEEEIRPFAETGKFNRGVSTLYGMLHRMDAGISRILETLRDHGLEENRMVLFTRDNGPQFGGSGKNRLERFHCQLHGAKGSVYEGGIRVAMLLHWPAGLQDRNACHEMVHCSDWFPTLLAMAGIERSDRPPRQHRRATGSARRSEADLQATVRAVEPLYPGLRVQRRLARRRLEAGAAGDSGDDALEQEDLAARHPGVVHRLTHELENWFTEIERERATIYDRPLCLPRGLA